MLMLNHLMRWPSEPRLAVEPAPGVHLTRCPLLYQF
jgi:hypothetical protein